LYSSIDGDSSIYGSDCDDDLSDRKQLPEKDPCFRHSVHVDVVELDVDVGELLRLGELLGVGGVAGRANTGVDPNWKEIKDNPFHNPNSDVPFHECGSKLSSRYRRFNS